MTPSLSSVATRFLQPLFLFLTVSIVSMAGAATYTFDNLSNGTLVPQDNWMTINGNNSSYVVSTGTGFDTTRVAGNPNSVIGGQDVHINGRTNNGNYSFGNLTGATGLTMSFDTQVQNNASQDQFINFALADANDSVYTTPGFSYRQSFGATPTWGLGQSAYSGHPGTGTSGSFPGSFATNDWIRLSLVMDFTASGGQGLGNLFFTDLTQGGGPVLLSSNFNLGLSGTLSTGLWNTMWSRSDFSSNVVFDNLTVNATFVPEVGSSWMAAACALLLGAHLVQRRRRTSR